MRSIFCSLPIYFIKKKKELKHLCYSQDTGCIGCNREILVKGSIYKNITVINNVLSNQTLYANGQNNFLSPADVTEVIRMSHCECKKKKNTDFLRSGLNKFSFSYEFEKPFRKHGCFVKREFFTDSSLMDSFL